MARIRAAELNDADAVIALGRQLHAESARYRRLRFSEEKARATFAQLQPSGGLLVADTGDALVGILVGLVVEAWFSTDLVAGDCLLYVDPAYRGGSIAPRLVRAFEAWAIGQGAREVSVGVSSEIKTERAAAFFERLGYRRSSISLLREVEP